MDNKQTNKLMDNIKVDGELNEINFIKSYKNYVEKLPNNELNMKEVLNAHRLCHVLYEKLNNGNEVYNRSGALKGKPINKNLIVEEHRNLAKWLRDNNYKHYNITDLDDTVNEEKFMKTLGGNDVISRKLEIIKRALIIQNDLNTSNGSALEPQKLYGDNKKKNKVLDTSIKETILVNNNLEKPENNKTIDNNDPIRKVRTINGVNVAIEWPKGSKRIGKSGDNPINMSADYGYIPHTDSPDGMDIDCYCGPNDNSDKVFKMEQMKNGIYDEDKYMLGFDSLEEALDTYVKNKPPVVNPGVIHALGWHEFTDKIARNLKKPEVDNSVIKSMNYESDGDKFWSLNWYKCYPKSGNDEFSYHHHWRGLSLDQSKMNEEQLLKTNKSVHGDLRMKFNSKDVSGFTIFLGTTKELESGNDFYLKKDYFRGTWKNIEPAGMIEVNGDIINPGYAGATSNYYAKFIRIEKGNYSIGVWREHSMEIFINNGICKGRYVISFVLINGNRIWLIRKQIDENPIYDKYNKDKLIKELKSKGQTHLIWSKPGIIPELITL